MRNLRAMARRASLVWLPLWSVATAQGDVFWDIGSRGAFDPTNKKYEIVEGQRITSVLEFPARRDDLDVRFDCFEKFDDEAVRRQHVAQTFDQKAPRYVHECPIRSDQTIESERLETALDHPDYA